METFESVVIRPRGRAVVSTVIIITRVELVVTVAALTWNYNREMTLFSLFSSSSSSPGKCKHTMMFQCLKTEMCVHACVSLAASQCAHGGGNRLELFSL